jgi:hypothetical protein
MDDFETLAGTASLDTLHRIAVCKSVLLVDYVMN